MRRHSPPPRRNVRWILAFAAAGAFSVSGCDSELTAPRDSGLLRGPATASPQAPGPWTTPAYPPLAIYIVYREYVHRNPGLTHLHPDDRRYQAYMERRLMQLYPGRGYSGMMGVAREEARRAAASPNAHVLAHHQQGPGFRSVPLFSTSGQCAGSSTDPNELEIDPSWDGQEEFAVPPDEQIPTIQMEIDSLQLVGAEVDNIYYYESLASGTYLAEPGSGGGGDGGGGGGGGGGDPGDYELMPLSSEQQSTLDDLIRAAAAGVTPHNSEVRIQISPLLVGAVSLGIFAGWKYYRVQQAADRAVQKSGAFYPHLAYSDTQRDAHRHIYFSMMLRRYVGATAAQIITDRHENDSSGPAKVMDLHNNDIGRTHRYHAFRGHWLWDRWDHGEWAVKVRNYINNESANGEFIPEWGEGPEVTTEQAWARRACVSVYRYIFFRR